MIKRLLTVSEPGRDGVFFCVRDWLRYLQERYPGLILDFAYSSTRGSPELDDFLKELSRNQGELLDMKIVGSPQLGDLRALFQIYRTVRKNRPDLIHAHSSKAGGLVRLLALLPGMPPIVYTAHAYYGMGGSKGIKEKFFTLLEKILAPLATTVCCSEDEAEFATKVLGVREDRMVICYHGLPEHAFQISSPEEKLAARKDFGLPADARILLTVGRDAHQKNYPALYEALPAIFSETKFLLVHVGLGSTELRNSLPLDCQSRVIAWEHLLKERMPALFKAADGFIMTSRYEGFSLAVLEALAEGLPLILTDVPGFRVYRALGFEGVRWIPLQKPEFSPALIQAVVDWDNSDESKLPGQIEKARSIFLQTRLHEKLETVYEKARGGR